MQINQILEEIGVPFTDISTHWLLRECPTCNKKDKLRIDKDTGKWICHKCYSDDEDLGKGNMWTLLPLLGVPKHDAYKLLFEGQVTTYTDDMEFKSIDLTQQEIEERVFCDPIDKPPHFIRMDCSHENWTLIPEAYTYLLERGVKNLRLIKKYDLMYSKLLRRVIFPFYQQGRLVGYQGRDITDRWKQKHPRCQNSDCDLKRHYYFRGEETAPINCPSCGAPLEDTFYPKTLTSFGFKKQSLLINFDMIDFSKPVILVEGPFDSINTPNSIPLLGKFLSKIQRTLLIENAKEVILYFDGDEDGSKATKTVFRQLELFVPKVSVLLNEDEEDPGQFSYMENLERIPYRTSFENWAFTKKVLV